jgi:hypothetical protein
MLPDDTADGPVILDLARELVVKFLQGGAAPEAAKGSVVTLVRTSPDLSA